MAQKNYAATAEQYCRDIVSGKIYASKWTILSCQRHLDDLQRQSTPGFPYKFSEAALNKFCRFCETFHIFEGPLTGQNIELMPWQMFVFSVLGWLCDGGERDGKRRFRRMLLEIPRGNSKSTMGALLSLWMLACDGEGGAQCVAAGTSRDVAKISWLAAAEMARREPKFMKALGVEILAHSIIQRKTASRFNPISADAKTSDGKNLHFCLFDECWAFPTRTLYESLETGTAKRDNSLMCVVGTAGFNTASLAYELRTYITKILQKQHIDESTWGIIYCAPDGEEKNFADENVWKAANPGFGRMVMPEVISQLAEKAKVTPSAVNSFLVKHLCVWCNADSAWMDMPKWNQMHDPNLTIDQFKGQQCYIGLDLATRSDIAAKIKIFSRMIDGKLHYYIFPTAYLPELAVQTSGNSQYKGWERQNLLTVTPGEVTDFAEIESDLIQDSKDFQVLNVGYDPWHAQQLAQRMIAENIKMVEVPMNVRSLSEPMKAILSLTLQGRLHHNNPILDWCMSNVGFVEDRNANWFPRKSVPSNKIDLAVATIIAMALAIEYGFAEKPKRTIFVF